MTTNEPTATVEITVTMEGQTKTFTASATSTGKAGAVARGLIGAMSNDANNWTHEVAEQTRRASLPTRPMAGRFQ